MIGMGQDFTELAAGVAALCGGTPVDQVEAAFALYDEDGDGYICKLEMEKLLTAVYRVMFQARPSYAQAIGTTASDLAALTTRHCFAEADSNADGKLRCARVGRLWCWVGVLVDIGVLEEVHTRTSWRHAQLGGIQGVVPSHWRRRAQGQRGEECGAVASCGVNC